jgi:hypothetical protein
MIFFDILGNIIIKQRLTNYTKMYILDIFFSKFKKNVHNRLFDHQLMYNKLHKKSIIG